MVKKTMLLANMGESAAVNGVAASMVGAYLCLPCARVRIKCIAKL
jgi:hypothetical protein